MSPLISESELRGGGDTMKKLHLIRGEEILRSYLQGGTA